MMNYIELINRFWDVNEEYSFRPTTVALYFYLLKINNGCSWKESFKHNNKKIEATLDISYKSLCGARNQLKQADLIEFKTQNGISNVTYSLAFGKKDEVTAEVQGEVSDEVTGEVRTRSGMSKDKLNKTKQKKESNGIKNPSPSKKTIEQRSSDFMNEIWKVASGTDYEDKVKLRKFYEYWSEHGTRDKKMRFEKQTSFNIKRRLGTWFENDKKFNNGTSTKFKNESVNQYDKKL